MHILIDRFDVFASGFLLTLQFCFLAAVGSVLLGTVAAVLRISPVPPLRAVGTAYVNLFRNVPLAVILFFTAFGLPAIGSNARFLAIPGLDFLFPRLGIDLPYFRFALVGLSLYTGAFVCEALRSGVNAVAAGQLEAARALGLTFTQNVRHVVLPQAFKAAVVPLGAAIVAMLKNSALIGFFGVGGDLSANAENLTSQEGLPVIPVFIGISIGYLMMTVPLGALLDVVEKRRR